MKAIRYHRFGDPDVLSLESVSDLAPEAGEVTVQVKAIGVNPVDTYIRAGKYGDRPFPVTPGMDAAGLVLAVGSGVTRVKPGDRVYVAGSKSGTYAEQTLCKESQVYTLPAALSFEQGAAIGVPYATAYYALFNRAHAMPGETVLIHGASGGVGIAAIQIARSRGLRIIGTAGTPKGLDLLLKEGAHHALDHHSAQLSEQVLALTDGKGVSIILEMLANVNLGKDLKMLATRGRVIVIGSRGPVEIDPRDTMGRQADIRGMSLITATEPELAVVHAALGPGLENGSLRPIIGQRFRLDEAAKSHEAVLKAGAFGKIVLLP